jgi:hypothetical protein
VNRTSHGRWGRYRKNDKGILEKLCNGSLHPEEGAWLPLSAYWFFKKGRTAGKPMSQCSECTKTAKGRDPKTSGLIAVRRIWWVFVELEQRLGKTEVCRRLNVSQNFWMRAERQIYFNMRRVTARRAIELLVEVRKNGEARHPRSIRRGAYRRGEKELPAQIVYKSSRGGKGVMGFAPVGASLRGSIVALQSEEDAKNFPNSRSNMRSFSSAISK